MGSDSLYDVSIILINYNTPDLLKECIQSIVRQTLGINYEIIVVDNASKENPQSLLKPFFPQVKFLIFSDNLGFGKANNLGVEQASGKYLMFLNSDTFLLNNAIKLLFDYLEANPVAGICGANLYDKAGRPNLSYFKFPVFRDEFRIFLPAKYSQIPLKENHNFTKKPLQVDCISGADLMIRSHLFRILNGFSPDFFMYYEETELTFRLSKMNYKAYSVPEAKIIHYQGMSSLKDRPKDHFNTQMLLSKFIYFRKTGGISYPRFIKRVHLSKCYTALVLCTMLRRKDKMIYWTDKRDRIKMVYKQYLSHF